MKIVDAVKTDRRAEKIVLTKANELAEGRDTIITEWSSAQRECGETSAFVAEVWSNGERKHLISCAVCDLCGDDDAFESEVLEIR